MAHANPYNPTAGFSNDASNNVAGRSAVNASALDAELLAASQSINQIINNQKLLQRDDGRLKDNVVEVHTLSREVMMLLGNYRLRGGWLPSTEYLMGDVAIKDGIMYVCAVGHISGTSFNEEPNWRHFGFAGSADAAQAAAQAINAANSAAASATSAQNAATTSTTKASEASASAASSSTSAASAQASANTATTSAAQAVSANNAAQSAAAAAQAAAQIGGVSIDRIVYGDDTSKTSLITQADLAASSGFYESSSDTPTTGKWLIATIKSKTGNERVQHAFKADDPSIQYSRCLNSSTKTPWLMAWNSSNLKLNELKSVGQISFFAMNTAPDGWLKANGAAVSRTVYAALFAAIGTSFGAGDGTTTFNLPDLRGEFIRGWDDGRGTDAARIFGSSQVSQNLSHDHGLKTEAGTPGYGELVFPDYPSSPWVERQLGSANDYAYAGFRVATFASGGNESRPRNIALLACIKY